MIPLDLERLKRESAAVLARSGRAAAEAGLRRADDAPSARCERCAGRGCYAERAGARRPFGDDFDAAAGDAFVASCPACRGLGRVPVSAEQAEANAAEALAAKRGAYRALRASLAASRGMTEGRIDAIVRRRLSATSGPDAWLSALRDVAREFGEAVR